jgi:excisionase family DNA binding protein
MDNVENTHSGATPSLTLTMREAATCLGISKSLAYGLANSGSFPVPVLRLGRRMVVSRAALMQLLGSPVEAASQAA